MSRFLDELLAYAVIFGPPLLAVVMFIISLIKFLTTDKADTQKRKRRKISMIVFGVIAGLLVTGLIALFIMLSFAMAHM